MGDAEWEAGFYGVTACLLTVTLPPFIAPTEGCTDDKERCQHDVDATQCAVRAGLSNITTVPANLEPSGTHTHSQVVAGDRARWYSR